MKVVLSNLGETQSFKPEIHLKNVKKLSVRHRNKTAFPLPRQNGYCCLLVYFEIHAKYINNICEQNAKSRAFTVSGTYILLIPNS